MKGSPPFVPITPTKNQMRTEMNECGTSTKKKTYAVKMRNYSSLAPRGGTQAHFSSKGAKNSLPSPVAGGAHAALCKLKVR